ncbi:LIC_10740 family protein [Leptospira sp. 'Mane']|uniref:LIC_10740 family protein n=1 Tax=Leptospira sp. 'Mane' TaxID=3387407 RepID=UPI00398B87FE
MLHPKIKEYSGIVKEKGYAWGSQFYRLGTGIEVTTNRFLFLFFSWFSLLLFFTFFILAEKNPFNLLVPFNVFQLPNYDHRSHFKIFISDGGDLQAPITRLVLANENKSEFIYQLIEEVGAPPYFLPEENKENAEIVFTPKKLLPLQYSLTNIWFREKEKTIILDWNETSLEQVMNQYRLARSGQGSTLVDSEEEQNQVVDAVTYYSGPEVGPKESEELVRAKKLQALAATFKAIDATILSNFSEITTIQHKLNGESREFPGLSNYSLSENKKTSN